MILQSRRGLLKGLGAIICAPAIVRASSLMPIKVTRDGVALVSMCHPHGNGVDGFSDLTEAAIEEMIIQVRASRAHGIFNQGFNGRFPNAPLFASAA